MLFQVSYERFLKEIGFEKITKEGKDKLEMEDLGDVFAFYLSSFDRPKEFVYVVNKKEFTGVQQLQLLPLSRPSVRIRDSNPLKIIEVLNRIEQRLQEPLRERVIERVIERVETVTE